MRQVIPALVLVATAAVVSATPVMAKFPPFRLEFPAEVVVDEPFELRLVLDEDTEFSPSSATGVVELQPPRGEPGVVPQFRKVEPTVFAADVTLGATGEWTVVAFPGMEPPGMESIPPMYPRPAPLLVVEPSSPPMWLWGGGAVGLLFCGAAALRLRRRDGSGGGRPHPELAAGGVDVLSPGVAQRDVGAV